MCIPWLFPVILVPGKPELSERIVKTDRYSGLEGYIDPLKCEFSLEISRFQGISCRQSLLRLPPPLAVWYQNRLHVRDTIPAQTAYTAINKQFETSRHRRRSPAGGTTPDRVL